MKTSLVLLSLYLSTVLSNHQEPCTTRTLSSTVPPSRLNFNASFLVQNIEEELHRSSNFTSAARNILSRQWDIAGAILATPKEHILALNLNSRLRMFVNQTPETQLFWRVFEATASGWGAPFKDCHFFGGSWLYIYAYGGSRGAKIGLFAPVVLDECDGGIAEIFGGPHKCRENQMCVDGETWKNAKRGQYTCRCNPGYFYPDSHATWAGLKGKDLESGRISNFDCQPCPEICPANCVGNGTCPIQRMAYLRTAILLVQLTSMGFVMFLAGMVFVLRKTKAIAVGMWTILETILVGVLVLYSTVIIRLFEPSVSRCLLEPWFREMGFVVCYGSIILKLYRHLIEFRTRKAHRWVVKDTDLLKYLLIMFLSALAYMAAYTALTLNFISEDFSLIETSWTGSGELFETCKYLWWDYVTEVGELTILAFGVHLAYASRNANTQFHESTFLCATGSIELAVSFLFYLARIFVFHKLHPDIVLIAYFLRSQLCQTCTLLLIFFPKFWYQQRQARTLAQEYSCRFPLDAFKFQERSSSANNSDVEISEITIADMNPDDIRAELKRLYLQLEMFKAKTICRDNPHISKRRGGRKAQHRRFSLQKGSREKVRRTMSLHSRRKDRDRDRKRDIDMDITEAEPSRTPEDSVCSTDGASAIYADLPEANQPY
uniref:G-protein coupled receptors family 3 profile domain-containing protein n=1 Tax=Dendroctonus ponderosae TaxID=77166 RepID=A0AAR5PL55_DENPD